MMLKLTNNSQAKMQSRAMPGRDGLKISQGVAVKSFVRFSKTSKAAPQSTSIQLSRSTSKNLEVVI